MATNVSQGKDELFDFSLSLTDGGVEGPRYRLDSEHPEHVHGLPYP